MHDRWSGGAQPLVVNVGVSTCWQAEAERACGRLPWASSSSSSGSSAMVLLRQAVFCGVFMPASASPVRMEPCACSLYQGLTSQLSAAVGLQQTAWLATY